MAAQHLRARSYHPELQRYTLEFRNGELLRHQDALTLAQYRSDARLARVHPEVPGQAV